MEKATNSLKNTITDSKSYQYYKDLPPWAKGVIIVGGIAVAYIFVSQIIKKIKDEQEKRKMLEKLKATQDELNNLNNSGILASYPKSQFNTMADRIREAFNGCDFSAGCPLGCWMISDMSNSGQTVYSIVNSLNNDRDFLELVDSFGVRTWDECGYFTGDVENKNLYEGIAAELNNLEIKYINELLKNRGINYSF